jgi:YidC/Oxa1 family membrane protein insertase
MFTFIVTLFDLILYYPLFNLLVLIYNYLPGHDFGIAVIILTLIIKIVLYPLSVKAIRSQQVNQRIQPQLQEIQKKYKDDKEKQSLETLELWRKEKINPFSTLFLVLIQLPIVIALYRVSFGGLDAKELVHLYSFVADPVQINSIFLHIIDLSKANWFLAALAAVLQFFQTKMLLPKPVKPTDGSVDVSQVMQKQMTYLSPFITVIILLKLPSAVALYWIVSGIFSIIQQYIILKKKNI